MGNDCFKEIRYAGCASICEDACRTGFCEYRHKNFCYVSENANYRREGVGINIKADTENILVEETLSVVSGSNLMTVLLMVGRQMIVISGNVGSDEFAIGAVKSVGVIGVTLLIVCLEIFSAFKFLTALCAFVNSGCFMGFEMCCKRVISFFGSA